MPTGAAGRSMSDAACSIPAALNAPLDLAHALQIIVHRRAILRAQLPLQGGRLLQ